MRDSTRIGLAYERINSRASGFGGRAAIRHVSMFAMGAAFALIAGHILGDIGARVSDSLDRAAAFQIEAQ